MSDHALDLPVSHTTFADFTYEKVVTMQKELEHFTSSGIIEVAIRNASVSDYMRHWEGRALCAEKDATRLNWLEAKHTLHKAVEILYVVDGYEVTLTHDGDPFSGPFHGQDLRAAIDAAMAV